MDYIVIRNPVTGEYHDDDVYCIDTKEDRKDARAAMREAGINSVSIYRGDEDGLDQVETTLVLFA